MLSADDPDATIPTVCQGLGALVAEHGPFPGIDAVSAPTETAMPRFGWRHTFDASGWKTWDDYYAAYDTSGLWALEDLVDLAGALTHNVGEAADHFRALGLPVTLCRCCNWPLTDRHPDWPGSWITTGDGMLGPVCNPEGEGFRDERYDRIHYGTPHQADTEPRAAIPHPRFARPALTAQER